MNIDAIDSATRPGAQEVALRETQHHFAHWRVDRVNHNRKGHSSDAGTARDKSPETSAQAKGKGTAEAPRHEMPKIPPGKDGVLHGLTVSDSLLETTRRIARRIVQHYFGASMHGGEAARQERIEEAVPPRTENPLAATVVTADGSRLHAELRFEESRSGEDAEKPANREHPTYTASSRTEELDGLEIRFSVQSNSGAVSREATVTFHKESASAPREQDAADQRREEHAASSLREVIRERDIVEEHIDQANAEVRQSEEVSTEAAFEEKVAYEEKLAES